MIYETPLITLAEAAQIMQVPLTTLRRKARTGLLPTAIKTTHAARAVWLVSKNYAVEYLDKADDFKSFNELVAGWVDNMRAGLITTPHTEATIRNRKNGLKLLFLRAKLKPSLSKFTPATLESALLTYHITRQRCYYGSREQMYKACLSFCRHLIRLSILTKNDLENFKTLKPVRLCPVKKHIASRGDAITLMDFIKTTTRFATEANRQLTLAAFGIMLYAGLRLQEVVELTIDDIKLDISRLIVQCGKGSKADIVSIPPKLNEMLAAYLNHYRPPTTSRVLLIRADGRPVTWSSLKSRFRDIAEWSGIHMSAHPLRRTCATMMSDDGAPLVYIQRHLRHSNIKTTMGYILPSTDNIHQWLLNWQPSTQVPG
jgi:integrase